MKLFRRIRYLNFNMENIKKYILYSIGEILLIVIGVLIAINVNNSNAEKGKEKQLTSIMERVKSNLENDINNLNALILTYESLDTTISDIINEKYPVNYIDTINAANQDNCTPCFAYHIGFSPFYSKLDGYEQLKLVNLDWNTDKSKITQDVLFFYQEHLRDIKLIEQTITGEILSNLRSIEQYDWYNDYMFDKFNPESIRYFHSDKVYKNKLGTYKILVIDNYLSMLKDFREEAIVLSKKL